MELYLDELLLIIGAFDLDELDKANSLHRINTYEALAFENEKTLLKYAKIILPTQKRLS
ncbi:MAG: hypothetical protein IPG08_10320 [Sphingobacteriaceae bacterium]|nr:hypothetical protein [Sphingobacteriaceae bacterium]